MRQDKIRNFCIIAHIDHGKSTLADRLLELTGTVEKRQMRAQLLDMMDLEREKGITIKLQPVSMRYRGYELNLIDTPGHVDFGYEVSRSLAACEGALLVVDATQGIQAQTLANLYLALEADLAIVPVVNKIDLPAADVKRTKEELVALIGCRHDEILEVSAKTGVGVNKVLSAIVNRVPPPKGNSQGQARALIFDSNYDEFRGVVLFVRLVDGTIAASDEISLIAGGVDAKALEVGVLKPEFNPRQLLRAGEIGYIVTSLRNVADARVGDTVRLAGSDTKPLSGYRDVTPFVYAGIYPADSSDYGKLKDAIEKLALNDAAMQYEPESSSVLGFGFRVGFLGLLHLEIVQQRLEREHGLRLVITNPSTNYEVELTNGAKLEIKNIADMPDAVRIRTIFEPWVKGEIICPKPNVGSVLNLIVAARGRHDSINYIDERLTMINFEAPLANILTDFYDALKSATSGYGSLSYEPSGYQAADLVKLTFLVAGEPVEALSVIAHRSVAEKVGRATVKRLKDIIPRQLFKISLQAAIGGKIIAREDIPALKKNVTGHLYGGDVSRKKKLWAKQARGKARMKRFGKVDIPPETFRLMLKKN